MTYGKWPLNFLTRARYIREKGEDFEIFLTEGDANRHSGSCLPSEYDFERMTLLSEGTITDEKLIKVIEMRTQRTRRRRKETANLLATLLLQLQQAAKGDVVHFADDATGGRGGGTFLNNSSTTAVIPRTDPTPQQSSYLPNHGP